TSAVECDAGGSARVAEILEAAKCPCRQTGGATARSRTGWRARRVCKVNGFAGALHQGEGQCSDGRLSGGDGCGRQGTCGLKREVGRSDANGNRRGRRTSVDSYVAPHN